MRISEVLAIAVITVSMILWAWKVVNWVYIRPKKLEKLLRKQGFSGNSYQFLFGDSKQDAQMVKEANSKPINVSDDDIVPRLLPFIQKTIIDYGNQSFMWMGPLPRVNILNPKHLREIFTKHKEFPKPKFNPFIDFIAGGLLSLNGQKWEKHRKIINPVFRFEKLEGLVPSINLCVSEMISKWENLLTENGRCELDVWPHIRSLTADIISRTAFGSSFEKGRTIVRILYEQALQINKASTNYLYIPGWRFLPTKLNKKMKQNEEEIRGLVKHAIDERRKAIRDGKKSDDLLGKLVESNLKEIEENGNENDNIVGLSVDDIVKECKLFYFAGNDTTASLLVWTMILLCRYPNWQALAREEVKRVFGTNEPDFPGLTQLKVITMILHEVLRFYPPVTALLRAVEKETQFGDGLSLPAGVEVLVPTIMLHRDPELWGPDANEFKLERFKEGILSATKGQFCYFPFAWGPRVCIGQNFGLIETKIALSGILQRFTLELSPSYSHSPSNEVVIHPQNGAQIILHKL